MPVVSEALAIRHETTDGGHTVLFLNGRLDAAHAESLKNMLKQIIDGGSMPVVVDLADVPFIDSAGLSALVFGLKLARRAGGDLMLAGVQPQTLTVLSLTMLDKVFTIYPTQEAALASLATHTAIPAKL
jgi:anti-sigma B factor antagonist